MNSDDFKRSVRAQRFDRSAGDAPNLGKVSRMPGRGRPAATGRRRRSGEGFGGGRPRRRFVVLVWTVLLGLTTAGVLGLGLWLGLDRAGKAPRPAVAQAPLRSEPAVEIPVIAEDEAAALVKECLAVRDPGQVATHFRTSGATPQEVVDFLSRIPEIDGDITSVVYLGGMRINGLDPCSVVVNYSGGKGKRNRLGFLIPDAGGGWRLDFESFARVVSPGWDAIFADAPGPMMVRVYAVADNYYNGAFGDEKKWICYGLASPDTEELFMGYCERGSAQAAAMAAIIPRPGLMTRVTLELARVPGASKTQFQITRVPGVDWLAGPEVLDEKSK